MPTSKRPAPAARKPAPAMLRGLAQANKQAASNFLADQQQRATAKNILHPHEVAGEWDSARVLYTTLGGALRPITGADLQIFERNAKGLGKQFKGGITVKGIIDGSLKDDRDRANREIHSAIPHQTRKGFVHFLVETGPKSKAIRRNVLIEFPAYDSLIAAPVKAQTAALSLINGPIKFDCDCERHRYWFRYVATIGKFNAGRAETGYPKIRNPGMVGVACKHVLRAVMVLKSPLMRTRLQEMIEAGRAQADHLSRRTKAADARAMADKQASQAHYKRNQLETSHEKRTRLAQQRGVQVIATQAAARTAKIRKDPAALNREMARLTASLKKLNQMGQLDAETMQTMLAHFTK